MATHYKVVPFSNWGSEQSYLTVKIGKQWKWNPSCTIFQREVLKHSAVLLSLFNIFCFYKSNRQMLWNCAIISSMQIFKRMQWLSQRKNSYIWRLFLHKTHLLCLGRNNFSFFCYLYFQIIILKGMLWNLDTWKEQEVFLVQLVLNLWILFETHFPYSDHSSFLWTFPAYCFIR